MKTLTFFKRFLRRPALTFCGLLAVLLCAVFPLTHRSAASQAGRDFNEADAALNVAYRALLNSIRDPEQRAALVAAQKSWIKYRDDDVAFFAARFPESKGGLFYNTDLTRQRTEALKTVLTSGDH